MSVLYRSSPEAVLGTYQLHYQNLHPGGKAFFHCHIGYHLQGVQTLTCQNASLPVWTPQPPHCRALCGGVVKNATMGRVLSPSPYPNSNITQERSCSWSLEAPSQQRLHLHMERLLLGPTDSEGPVVRIQFITEHLNSHTTSFNIRYEAFEKGHCYEPFIQNGNFTTTDVTFMVGTLVHFSCDPGHTLEQGPPIIECVNPRDPYWNDTEPLCRALCGGDLSGSSGLILSPNWPEWYGEGEPCTWRIHTVEDKRIVLDMQLLNLSDSDLLMVLDGSDASSRILAQFVGGSKPLQLASSGPDLSISFHSDPIAVQLGRGEGFIISYVEVSANDSCQDLPEIQNGRKHSSHAALVRGAQVLFQCDPGFDLVGSDTLICQPDLKWSALPPFCDKIMYCLDPGQVAHASRSLSDPKLLVGTVVEFSCSPGFILQGGATLTCYGREPGTPVWTSHLPRCVSEESVSCDNPGLPDNGYQLLSKRSYVPGETLTFMCYSGYELIGEPAIRCILGNSSFWSRPLPICRANHGCSGNHALEVAEAASVSVDGGTVALSIFFLLLLVSLLLSVSYCYITRCRYHANLRLPLIYPHPYSQISVDTEFDNPLYENGGESREYEVSI
ncbi:hypothetical protein DNTS_017248 [Danionella cerebrum]|uniref:Seizure related 6 homolog (mouse)-like n=1 Tax=Danionella cerebrum TaxID=2873325 RepID=A0A553RAG6_9TELE|nr:hypothetical protein DNTS_017248 [Danionella translucida]